MATPSTTTYASLSTHGIGAIQTDTDLKIIFDSSTGSAVVTQSPGHSEGWLYFTLPSPSTDYNYLRQVTVDFTPSGEAIVNGIQVYQGDSKLLDNADTKVYPNTTYNIGAYPQSNGNGLVAAIYVKVPSATRLSIASISVLAYQN